MSVLQDAIPGRTMILLKVFPHKEYLRMLDPSEILVSRESCQDNLTIPNMPNGESHGFIDCVSLKQQPYTYQSCAQKAIGCLSGLRP
jgi:hypothetical protein